jgi:hypothetical protein
VSAHQLFDWVASRQLILLIGVTDESSDDFRLSGCFDSSADSLRQRLNAPMKPEDSTSTVEARGPRCGAVPDSPVDQSCQE